MIFIIHRFHDSMRACGHLDSGETFEWFGVNQGLRQGCVVASDLSNIFEAALTVAFDRFSINEAVADGFISVAARGGRTRGGLSKVLWVMVYADDAGIASRS